MTPDEQIEFHRLHQIKRKKVRDHVGYLIKIAFIKAEFNPITADEELWSQIESESRKAAKDNARKDKRLSLYYEVNPDQTEEDIEKYGIDSEDEDLKYNEAEFLLLNQLAAKFKEISTMEKVDSILKLYDKPKEEKDAIYDKLIKRII